MAVGEPLWKTQQRDQEMQQQFPELQYASPEELMQVDNYRLTSGTGAVSDYSAGVMQLAAYAAEQEKKKQEEEAQRAASGPMPEGVDAGSMNPQPLYPTGTQENGPMPAEVDQGRNFVSTPFSEPAKVSGVPRGVAEAQPDTVGAGPVYDSGSHGIDLPLGGSLLDNQNSLPSPVQHALNTPVLGTVLNEAAKPSNWMAAAALPVISGALASLPVVGGVASALTAMPEGLAGQAAQVGMAAGSRIGEEAAQHFFPDSTLATVGGGLVGGAVGGGLAGAAVSGFEHLLTPQDAYESFSGLAKEALKVSDQLPDTAKIPSMTPMMSGASDGPMLSPTAQGSATQRLFGLQPVQPGLSPVDKTLNALKETIGVGVPENDIATPIMRERARVQFNVDSQAQRLGATAQDISKAFPVDDKGRIITLPGEPTVQDVAAKLPQYWNSLAPEQRTAMQRLQAEVAPYADSLKELGVDVNQRADVVDGGFYLPRGRADVEGADVPMKVGTGRGGAGGKKGFEKAAVFDSMTQGIDAGYQYASLPEALQSYAKEAGSRSLNKWTEEQFKATGLGETAADRINPNLRAQVETLRANIASTRQQLTGQTVRATERDAAALQAENIASRGSDLAQNAEGRLKDITASRPNKQIISSADDMLVVKPLQPMDEVISAAQRELAILNREAGKQAGRAETASERGGAAMLKADELGKKYDDLRQQLDDISGSWKHAQEVARSTPRDQGGIGLAGLNGTTFPDAVANVANKYLNAERPATGKAAGTLNAVTATNNLLRGLRATADVSWMGIQGLLGAASHPVAYGKALTVALKSIADDNALGSYITHFDEQAAKNGTLDSRAWASQGLHIGGSDSEFAVKGALPFIKQNLANAPLVKQANRSFGVFGDALRLETADAIMGGRKAAGMDVSNATDIARAANLITGWGQHDLGGLGNLAEFAPRFFRSQLDLVAHAMLSGHMEGTNSATGDEARRALIRLVGIGTAITVGANEASGHDTDFHPGSPNFMRIRDVGGQDVSLFGPWDSFVRGITSTANGDPTYLLRTKASPTVALAWDLISGKTFTGQNSRTPEALLQNFMPFSFQGAGGAIGNAVQSAQQGGGVAGVAGALAPVAVGLTGVKESPMTPTEQLDRIAQDQHGKNLYDLEPAEREAILKANPDLATQKLDKASATTQEGADVRAKAFEQQQGIDDQLKAAVAKHDPKAQQNWQDATSSLRDRTEGALGNVYKDSPQKKPDPTKPWEMYGKIIADNTDPVSNKVDWNAVDTWRSGLDATQNAAIDTNTGLHSTPYQQERRAVMNTLDRTGYFAVMDKAWAEAQQAAPAQFGQFKTEDDYRASIDAMIRQQLPAGINPNSPEADIFVSQAESKIGILQKLAQFDGQHSAQWQMANPQLAKQAIEYGILNPAHIKRSVAGGLIGR